MPIYFNLITLLKHNPVFGSPLIGIRSGLALSLGQFRLFRVPSGLMIARIHGAHRTEAHAPLLCAQTSKLVLGHPHPHARLAVILAGVAAPISPWSPLFTGTPDPEWWLYAVRCQDQ